MKASTTVESMTDRTQVVLSIRNRHKGIPYFGGIREGGSVNYGFRPLKGKPVEAAEVPEVQDEEHLKNALVVINDSNTAFFTTACEKSFNHDDNGFWAKGFLEFSYNYTEMVTDAQNYFKLFFEFNRSIWQQGFNEPVQYHWELEGAVFTDCNSCTGYTACVWIATADFDNQSDLRSVWGKSVDFLVDFLREIPLADLRTIY